jgi:hypothetical protein
MPTCTYMKARRTHTVCPVLDFPYENREASSLKE